MSSPLDGIGASTVQMLRDNGFVVVEASTIASLRAALARSEEERGRLLIAWIAARAVVRAARVAVGEWPNAPDDEPLDDAMDKLHDCLTAYDQRHHNDPTAPEGSETKA
jgi:hypothetical protein